MGFVRVGGGVYTLTPSDYPFTISSRQVLKAGGSPFLMNGDAGWSSVANLPSSDLPTYFADRQAKGVTLIMLSMIEHNFSEQTPKWRNKLGDDPFTGTVSAGNPDFTTPNEAYWSHVDYVINLAATYGLTIMAAPAYMGFAQGTEGWASVIFANGTTNMTTYGTFLGNRYKTFKNLIWLMGGDAGPTGTVGDLTVHVNNLANAIKAQDTVHLMSAHPAPGNLSTTDYNQTWLDINAAYPTDHANVNAVVRSAYQTTPIKPIFMIEGEYGNEHSITDILLRIQMYQSVLGGGLGHIYGQNPTWYFGVDASASGNSFSNTGGLDWHTQLSNFGASFLPYVKRLQVARPLITLTPDYSHVVVTSGFGSDGITYAPVLANSNMLVAYTNGVALTVAKTQFNSVTFNYNWYNPRDGTTTAGGTVAMGSSTQVFTPPTTGGGNDWVLIAEAQSLGLGNP